MTAPLRRGLTLLELLLAMSLLVAIAGTLGTLARAVQVHFEYAEGHGAATQHARVVLERIARTVEGATANEQFPGVLVLATPVGTARFPDTLVVWKPEGRPADARGLPRYNELIVYCLDPGNPAQLVELTMPADTRAAPPPANTAAWLDAIDAARRSRTSRLVRLTDMLRVASPRAAGVSASGDDPTRRGVVAFFRYLQPSEAEWAAFRADPAGVAWNSLTWPQGSYGPRSGRRQVRVEIELQLTPVTPWTTNRAEAATVLPFFGSAVLDYPLPRETP